MSDFMRTLQISTSGMQAQTQRLVHISENIANADTPGYRRKTVSFEQHLFTAQNAGEVRLGDVFLDRSDLPDIYDPNHPMSDTAGYYQGSNVNLITEIADGRQARRSYEANLRMFDQARQMSSSLMDLIRKR